MRIEKARAILRLNIEKMSLEQLQKHYVNVIDAWRCSKADYGFTEAVKNGFYKIIFDNEAQGFSPSDIWLTSQLAHRLTEIEILLKEKLKENKPCHIPKL